MKSQTDHDIEMCGRELTVYPPKSEPPVRSSEIVSWCVWKLDEWHGYYDTDCGEAYCFEEGRPRENHYRYCPGCGRKLRTTPLTPANDRTHRPPT